MTHAILIKPYDLDGMPAEDRELIRKAEQELYPLYWAVEELAKKATTDKCADILWEISEDYHERYYERD